MTDYIKIRIKNINARIAQYQHDANGVIDNMRKLLEEHTSGRTSQSFVIGDINSYNGILQAIQAQINDLENERATLEDILIRAMEG